MTAAITTLRATLATDLANAGVWDTFDHVPEVLSANSIVIEADDPYITPSNNTYSAIAPMAHFKIIMLLPLRDNQGNINAIETFAVAVFTKLEASSLAFHVGDVSAPSVITVGGTELLKSEISISTLTTWS
jgi:hypothetical protein